MSEQTKAASFVHSNKNAYDFSYVLTVIVTSVGGAMVIVGTILNIMVFVFALIWRGFHQHA